MNKAALPPQKNKKEKKSLFLDERSSVRRAVPWPRMGRSQSPPSGRCVSGCGVNGVGAPRAKPCVWFSARRCSAVCAAARPRLQGACLLPALAELAGRLLHRVPSAIECACCLACLLCASSGPSAHGTLAAVLGVRRAEILGVRGSRGRRRGERAWLLRLSQRRCCCA